MTKLRAMVHLGMGGGGWTSRKKLIRTSLILAVPFNKLPRHTEQAGQALRD